MTQALKLFHAQLVGRSAAARTITNHTQTVTRLNRELHFDQPGLETRIAVWYKGLQKAFDREFISGAKVRNDIVVLRQFFDVMVEMGQLPTNPIRQLRWPGRSTVLPKRTRWKPRPMPMDDVARLLTVVQPDLAHPDPLVVRDRAMLELFLNGLRRVEVVRLNTTDVSYDTQQETLVVRVLGKGSREGDVPLNPNSAKYLALHLLISYVPEDWREWVSDFEHIVAEDGQSLALLKACERLLTKRIDAPDPVFFYNGRRLTERTVNRLFEDYRTQAGLGTTYGPHSLRHTCATELLEHDVDSRIVQELLRHSSIAVTQIYMDVRKGPKARAMRKLPVPSFPEGT